MAEGEDSKAGGGLDTSPEAPKPAKPKAPPKAASAPAPEAPKAPELPPLPAGYKRPTLAQFKAEGHDPKLYEPAMARMELEIRQSIADGTYVPPGEVPVPPKRPIDVLNEDAPKPNARAVVGCLIGAMAYAPGDAVRLDPEQLKFRIERGEVEVL